LPLHLREGWEAAVFDHFQAMANVIAQRAEAADSAAQSPLLGGSTFHFDLHEDHPLRDQATGIFQRIRRELSDLRARIDHENQTWAKPVRRPFRLVLYVGQHVTDDLEQPPQNPETDTIGGVR
jgi:hypothetical protein